tara:strand:+ start:8608 stop:8979 length:372 start_codon:yes stop_codon:yes gene_type:complete
MYDRTHYSTVPERTLEALDNWAKSGQPPGGFVAAVLENDLADSVRRADSRNSAALVDIVRYLINELPRGCWGSFDKVASWGESDHSYWFRVEGGVVVEVNGLPSDWTFHVTDNDCVLDVEDDE